MYRLVVVVLVAILVQVDEGVLEDLVDGSLTPSRGTHAHQPMANQLGFVQLDDFTDLGGGGEGGNSKGDGAAVCMHALATL